MSYLLIFVLSVVAVSAGFAQVPQSSQTGAQPSARSASTGGEAANGSRSSQASSGSKQATDPGSALDFLGSYSAPQAVLATETGHTSSRPPSVATDRRLADLSSDLGEVPADPAEARRELVRTLAAGEHSPEEWFRAGTAALGAARADSQRLAEIAPASDWNRRFQAEALAGRYPLIARSLWPAAGSASQSRSDYAAARRNTATDEVISPTQLSQWRDELSRFETAAETPEMLYRRARLFVEISGAAYRMASASPVLDARLFALQALAAEEENDEGAALLEYRAGLSKYPQNGLLHAGLGHLYRERNELDLARAELAAAERLLPADALVAFDLGDVELRMGDPAKALETLNRVLDLDPSLLVARWSRGRAYTALGGDENNQRALEDLEAASSCDTSGALAHQLAQLYSRLGRTTEAQQAEDRSQEQRKVAEQQKHAAAVKGP